MIAALDDVLAVIRNNRSMYFAPSPQVAARILDEALTLGAGEATVLTREGIWLVAADIDWFSHAHVGTRELFSRIVPFNKGEANSMWAEILLVAYCESVLTWSRTETLAIKGNPHTFDPLLEHATRNDAIQRIVAFTALH